MIYLATTSLNTGTHTGITEQSQDTACLVEHSLFPQQVSEHVFLCLALCGTYQYHKYKVCAAVSLNISMFGPGSYSSTLC